MARYRLREGAIQRALILCGWGVGAGVIVGAARAAPGAQEVVAAPTEALTTRALALMQIDWVAYRQSSQDELDPSSGVPLNEERFVLRRARGGYVIEYPHFIAHGELEVQAVRELAWAPYEASLGARGGLSFEQENPEKAAAPRSARLGALLKLGLFRIPFGHDVTEASEERATLERTTFANALFPGQRDLGVGLDLRFSVLRFSLAWMNGEPIGEGAFAGLDTTRMKDWVGRIGVELRLGSRLTALGGFSGLSGQGLHAGTPATKDQLAWSDGNEDGVVELSELSVLPGAPATPSETYGRFAIGADAALRYELPALGELEVKAEVVRAKNLDRGLEPADPIGRGRNLRELGWCFGVSQELTAYGEVAVRYDVYDPDADARRQTADKVVPVDARYRTLSVALAGKVKPFRLLLEYARRGNALGLSETGAPTTLADDSLTLRGEFSH